MNSYTVSFFGHRIIDDPFPVEEALGKIVRALLKNKEYVSFLVGRDGEFDQLVASTVRRCKREVRSDNSALVWMMPYLTAEYRDNEESFRKYYDEIEVCESAIDAHYKAAFQIRNRVMVDRSDLVVFYVQKKNGGAYQTLRYAQKQGKTFTNLHGEWKRKC